MNEKTASTIFAAVAGVGVAATAYLSAHQTKKAMRDHVPGWKDYIPVIVSGAATIGCIVGAQVCRDKYDEDLEAVWAAATGAAYKALTTYQNKVFEHVGTEEEHAIREEAARENLHEGWILAHNMDTDTYFECNLDKVIMDDGLEVYTIQDVYPV